MKSSIKPLPSTQLSRVISHLRSRVRSIKTLLKWRLVFYNWNIARRETQQSRSDSAGQRILVFPADLRSVSGSLGDSAMIAATTDAFRSVFPELQVDLLCLRTSEEQVLRMGFVPTTMPSVDSYNLLTFPREIAGLFESTVYDALIVLGADVMDGYYGVTHPAMALIASDIAARHGVSTSIVGASFNQSPAIQLAPLFNRLDPRVNLNIRDPISLERIKAFASVSPRLVADAAFSLTPGVPDGDAAAWIEQERSAGRCVIGVNMHPMLIKDATDADVDRITSCMSLALRAVSANVAVSWILIPHDYRRKFQRDETCLKLIHQKLEFSRRGILFGGRTRRREPQVIGWASRWRHYRTNAPGYCSARDGRACARFCISRKIRGVTSSFRSTAEPAAANRDFRQFGGARGPNYRISEQIARTSSKSASIQAPCPCPFMAKLRSTPWP